MDEEGYSTNIDDLRNKFREKCNTRMKIYKKLLEKCYFRINNAASNDNAFCIYPLPDFILGMPMYNLAYCAAYIIFDLKKNGFNATFFNPNIIFVGWNYEQPSYLMTNNNKTISFHETKLLIPPTSNTSKVIEIPNPVYNKQRQIKSINDYKPSGRFLS